MGLSGQGAIVHHVLEGVLETSTYCVFPLSVRYLGRATPSQLQGHIHRRIFEHCRMFGNVVTGSIKERTNKAFWGLSLPHHLE